MFDILAQLKNNRLTEHFDILDVIDLSLFHKKNGEQIIHDKLTQLYRPIFENNQRIFVIQPNNDFYTYPEQLASDALIFLQKYLQKIDISNCFVTVISSNPEIETDVNWLRSQHSTDNDPINFIKIDGEFNKQYPQDDTFCIYMWKHLYVSTQLEILPCCLADSTKPLGNLVNNSVEEIINSPRAREIRLNMLSKKKCTECASCYNMEKQGLSSYRQRFNHIHHSEINDAIALTNPDGSLKEFSPNKLDIRLNNTCNLKCRTCGGNFSSQLAHEEKKLFNNIENFKKIPTKKQRDLIFKSVTDYIGNAKSIYFAGGEPLIMSEHYQILDQLIEFGNTSLTLTYNTNFTKLTFKDKNVLDYWKHFSNVKVGASLDGHGRIFEYVRHGAKWEDIESNFDNLIKECPHVNFTVASTVGILSVESVIELQQLWHDTKNLDLAKFKISPVIGDYLTLPSLLPHHKIKISEKIKKHCQWLSARNAVELVDAWQNLENLMWSSDKSYVNRDFAKINKARDIAREENFETTYPHFSDLFSFYYN